MAGAFGFLELGAKAFEMDIQRSAAREDKARGKMAGLEFDRTANLAAAQSQQKAKVERKRARLLASRAQAVAGASGAGTGDPQIADILAGINTEGEMNALNEIFTGQERARRLRLEGDNARRYGYAKSAAGNMAALATGTNAFLNFASENPSFFQKYGGMRAKQSAAAQEALGSGYAIDG